MTDYNKVELYARFVTSDYDHGEGPAGGLFDDDVIEGAYKATNSILKYLQHLAKSEKYQGRYQRFNDDDVLRKIKPAMTKIARNFWRDLDYDDRKKLAQVREEVSKLLSALANLTSSLKDRPHYVRTALNFEAGRLASSRIQRGSNLYDTAMEANSALLEACELIISQDRERPGEAVRFRNACCDLAALWEEMLGKKFPKTTKYTAGRLEEMTGVQAAFDSPAAQFVYIAIFRMGRGWVKPSQVEAAIKMLPKRKLRSSAGR